VKLRRRLARNMTVTMVLSPFRSGKSGFGVEDDLLQGWPAIPWQPYFPVYIFIFPPPEINQ
jgi:hypothetical protein